MTPFSFARYKIRPDAALIFLQPPAKCPTVTILYPSIQKADRPDKPIGPFEVKFELCAFLQFTLTEIHLSAPQICYHIYICMFLLFVVSVFGVFCTETKFSCITTPNGALREDPGLWQIFFFYFLSDLNEIKELFAP